MQGWIKLHRKVQQSAIWTDSCAVHLWVHLLLKANHEDNEVFINSNIIEVKRGQLLTGRKKLSAETGINESKIQRLLKTFEKCHMIEQRTNNANRLISILNYDSHQVSEQPVNNERTTSEHKQECKELKNNTMSWLDDADERYLKMCERFYQELKRLDRIKANTEWKCKSWYDAFRLLLTNDGVSSEEFSKVMRYYFNTPRDQYTPIADSPVSVRSKWQKLKDYYKRGNDKPKPPPSYAL